MPGEELRRHELDVPASVGARMTFEDRVEAARHSRQVDIDRIGRERRATERIPQIETGTVVSATTASSGRRSLRANSSPKSGD